ncbi:hypothetical protein BC830DRAFT_786208 [Chytriomyces sp. MP71]|nr:hypothetical protein BC830DRAFT_786208 [Chytriomyces sp. MP71]
MKRMDSISSEVAGAAEQKQAGSPGNTESERTSFQFMKRPAPIQTKPVEQNSYRMREELDFDNIRTVEITSQPNINDADTESDSDLERTLDAKERLSYSGRCGSTYSWIEPADIDEIEVSESLRRADEIVDDRLKQSMHRTAPKFSDAKATVPKAPSRLEQVTSAHSKRLYGQVKDSIYRGAANTISKFESEPHFLVNTFKGLQKLDTPFLRQKFMLVLESLMEERDQILTEAETEEDTLLLVFRTAKS